MNALSSSSGSLIPASPKGRARLTSTSSDASNSNCSLSRSSANVPTLTLNRQQKKCLFCILLVNFACYITYAVIAPFYTVVAQSKGLDQFHVDMIFSGYALASVLISPVWGRLVAYSGCKPMLLMGLAVNGVANISFGFLDRIDDVDMFFYTSLVLRCLEAFGTIAMVTASYTYVIRMFPDCVGYVFGLTETAVGMGKIPSLFNGSTNQSINQLIDGSSDSTLSPQDCVSDRL
jgi:MFS family permease